MASNLGSRGSLLTPCNFDDLRAWYADQVNRYEVGPVARVMLEVGRELDAFVRWPTRALLLWRDCDRRVPAGARQRYHRYPGAVRDLADSKCVKLDGRANGPAIAAFALADGKRPDRAGSMNCWSIHHIYSGKFPYPERVETLHAAKCGKHFTQSAGLVAVHPVADGLADECPAFAWLLRAEAFRRFRYDPDLVFSANRDDLGFADGADVECFYAEPV